MGIVQRIAELKQVKANILNDLYSQHTRVLDKKSSEKIEF